MRRTLLVDRQLVRVGGNDPVLGPVKDKRNRPRTIPLPQVVIDELSAHVALYGLGAEGLIFTVLRGGAIARTTFSDMWGGGGPELRPRDRRSRSVARSGGGQGSGGRSALQAAGPLGIPAGEGYHQLRHFYASLLIRHGESIKTVQDRLGHTSAQMTLDVTQVRQVVTASRSVGGILCPGPLPAPVRWPSI